MVILNANPACLGVHTFVALALPNNAFNLHGRMESLVQSRQTWSISNWPRNLLLKLAIRPAHRLGVV